MTEFILLFNFKFNAIYMNLNINIFLFNIIKFVIFQNFIKF